VANIRTSHTGALVEEPVKKFPAYAERESSWPWSKMPQNFTLYFLEVEFFQPIRIVAEKKSTLILFSHLPLGICSEC
jgi:hypothetical protein